MANQALEQTDFMVYPQAEDNRGSWIKDMASPAVFKSSDRAAILKVQQAGEDKPDGDKPDGDTQPDGGARKSPLDILRDAAPKDLGPGLKTMQGLAETFEHSPDKAKALTQLRGNIEGAVKQSDDDFEAAKKTFEAERTKLKPLMEPKVQAMETAQKAFGEKFQKVPEDDRARVGGLLQLYDNPKNSPALKRAIEGEINHYPGLMPAAKGLIKAESELSPLVEKAQKIKGTIEEAAAERVGARMAYGQMAAEGGDSEKAHRMEMESRALIMGVPLDKVDELEKRMKQQGK